jgi:hypothetical protein
MTIIVLTLAFLYGCANQVFDGSSTGNDNQFILNYSILNCTKTHDMNLSEGTVINVSIKNSQGNVDVLVAGKNGQTAYKGDNADNSEFLLTITQTDTYTFSITGKNAGNGIISFVVKK